jgi:epoxyqueuosine reductase QueG
MIIDFPKSVISLAFPYGTPKEEILKVAREAYIQNEKERKEYIKNLKKTGKGLKKKVRNK